MRIFCLLAMLCPMLGIAQQIVSKQTVQGQVYAADNNNPLPDVQLYLVKARRQQTTGPNGQFNLTGLSFPDTLIVSLTGYRTQKTLLSQAGFYNIRLEPVSNTLADVVLYTGYQALPKERSAGSFVQIDSALLNRRVGSNVLDRLDGVASGLLFNRNKTAAANESDIVIRGRSTLFASPDPLIIVDNFPFDGDINTINPNDVQSVTLLRDATAASIWGVRAGNGVIVITTKKSTATKPRIQFNSNITVGEKPDLYYQPVLSSKDYLTIESFLFSKGYYNSRINSPYLPIPAGVDILSQRRSGLISATDSANQLGALAAIDTRSDLLRYFYRTSVTQQQALSISGGDSRHQYYLSAGYDKALQNQVGGSNDRISLRVQNNLQPLQRLTLSSDLNFVAGRNQAPSSVFSQQFPVYTQLIGQDGTALPVYKDYKKKWLDTIGQGQLLDWTYRPYDELRNANNSTNTIDYRLNIGLVYKFQRHWDISLNYQFQKGSSDNEYLQNSASYYTRDLINRYTQPDYTSNNPVRNIPLGQILDVTRQDYRTHNARLQVHYTAAWHKDHKLDGIAGMEVRDYTTFSRTERLFGYNPDNATDITVNLLSPFPTLPNNISSGIPNTNKQSGAVDRYLSYFTNLGYSFRDKYFLNASARKDASNLFGVDANQRAVPLWSLGAGWMISRERFLHKEWLDMLKLRFSFGYSGNVDKSTTAYTTAGVGFGSSFFYQPFAFLVNPPNPDLSWEKIGMWNAGIDFSLFHHLLNGSVEYFIKSGRNLIGNSQVASQTGVTQFRQNIANLQTKGLDLTLTANPVRTRSWNWSITFLYSYAADKITRYLLPASQVKAYVTTITSNPLQGKPWSAVFAYPWAGLNPQTGDPQGILNGQASNNFTRLINPLSTDELVYKGAGRPTSFGSLRQDISWKRFSLSVNMVYELGFYFRRPSVNYTTLFSQTASVGVFAPADIAARWQQPGDEMHTNIPSMIYPAVSARDEFYQYSDVLVEKGDHLRLQDIRLGYDLSLSPKSMLRSCRFYVYLNNIGVLWAANHAGLDPHAITGYPTPRTAAAGVSIQF